MSTVFDTSKSSYSSISGTHTGTIKSGTIAEGNWSGYEGDWRNISFDKLFILKGNETYNYTIRTGSYPQIIHVHTANVTGGTITCEEFVDANGKSYNDWIPAIKLYSTEVASASSNITDDMGHAGGVIPAIVFYKANNSARNRLFNALKSENLFCPLNKGIEQLMFMFFFNIYFSSFVFNHACSAY